MKIFSSLCVFLITCFSSYSQVGINTSTPNPNSALDVNGKVIIQDLGRASTGSTGVKIMLTEGDGTLIQATIPSDMIFVDSSNNDAITIRPRLEKIYVKNESFGIIDDYDAFANAPEATVLIINSSGGGNELKIRGIIGGYEGRILRIINNSGNKKIKFEEDHNSGTAGNKIYVYTKENKMEEKGTATLIYSTTVDSDGYWCVVQLEKGK